MVEEQLNILIGKILHILNHLTVSDFVVLLGIFFIPVLILSAIYLIIISPLICKFYIVPRIEKKLGRKLGYSPLLKFAPFGNCLDRQIEISKYIIDRYFAYKKRGEKSVPFGYNLFALKQAGYTIDMVSKAELIFSFMVEINLYVSAISFFIVFVAACFNGEV